MTSSSNSTATPDLLTALGNKATTLRIESVKATSEAGSGHPSSCCSAADIVAVLFFSVMRYDPKNLRAFHGRQGFGQTHDILGGGAHGEEI